MTETLRPAYMPPAGMQNNALSIVVTIWSFPTSLYLSSLSSLSSLSRPRTGAISGESGPSTCQGGIERAYPLDTALQSLLRHSLDGSRDGCLDGQVRVDTVNL